jgi:hypothetical protein
MAFWCCCWNNQWNWRSDTAYIRVDSSPIIANDKDIGVGSSQWSRIRHSTVGNDTLQIGVLTSETLDSSGAVAIITSGHLGSTNRSPGVTHQNPNLYIYSADNSNPNDYVRIEHDQTNANIIVGSGNLNISPASGGIVQITSGISASGLTLSGDIYAPNIVNGISGATGNIGLVAGANVTITQAGRTFTIISSSGGGGTPAGSAGYVQYYSASGFSADDGLVYDSSLEQLRVGSTTRYLTLYTSGTDSIVEGNGNSSLYLQHTNPVYVGDGISNGNNTYLVVDDSTTKITLNALTVDILGNVTAPNIVNGISGATGNIGLVAGTNVTITQAGRTFTINSSGSGSPSGNYVNTYDGRTGDVVTPPLLLYSLGII